MSDARSREMSGGLSARLCADVTSLSLLAVSLYFCLNSIDCLRCFFITWAILVPVVVRDLSSHLMT